MQSLLMFRPHPRRPIFASCLAAAILRGWAQWILRESDALPVRSEISLPTQEHPLKCQLHLFLLLFHPLRLRRRRLRRRRHPFL
jgi:hypothetical protein